MIETERLRLRPFKLEDLPHMQRYGVREEYYRYLPLDPLTPESIAEFHNHLMSLQDQQKEYQLQFAIEPITIRHIVGAINLNSLNLAHQSASVGYALDSEYQGLGYMTEALMAILDYGFTTLSLHRIWAYADPRNTKSWKVMERAGLKREGLLREDKFIRGNRRDSYLYSILKPEWKSR